jgi:hypothetical protein
MDLTPGVRRRVTRRRWFYVNFAARDTGWPVWFCGCAKFSTIWPVAGAIAGGEQAKPSPYRGIGLV